VKFLLTIIGVVCLLATLSVGAAPGLRFKPADGDIIFQTSLSAQSRAIRLATRSRYSHMGIIFYRRGRPYVFEAAATVRYTPLPLWINKGKDEHYVIKRLKGQVLGRNIINRLRKTSRTFSGKPYDLYFGWSDKRLYCSELVWKIYKRAMGIDIGQLQRLEKFDLDHPVVRKKLTERYGKYLPLKERVISPQAMFASRRLVTVWSGSN
jgi:Permuted papain-like amidase enzyme, YaeF/YiiX, C92 family